MKELDGLTMTDEFFEYAKYKKDVGEILEVPANVNEDGKLIAVEFEISKKEKFNMQIFKLRKQLENTDYIATKLAEANAEYIVTEDKTKLIELQTKYAKDLANREQWRKEVNDLQDKLKALEQKED